MRILFDKNSHVNKNSQLDKVNLKIKYKSSSLITRIDKDKNDKQFLRKILYSLKADVKNILYM